MSTEGLEQCEGKNCYTRGRAENVARAVMKARNRKVRVYECYKCHTYHLTSESIGEYGGKNFGKPKWKRDKNKKYKNKWYN